MKREPRVNVRQVLRSAGVMMVAVLVFAAEARADSAIVGTLTSADGKKPVPGAVVTATSPELKGEPVVAVTNELGLYRLSPLPPGLYGLRFEKEGFRPRERDSVVLRPHRTIRINVELLPSDMEEEVIIIGPCGGPMDLTSSTTDASFDAETLARLAVSPPSGKDGAVRSLESAVELVPGARSGAYGVSIHGATAFENEYTVDGFSTTDPLLGVNALPVSLELLHPEYADDVKAVTGGFTAEYGRATGGIIEARTRSGWNEYHGSVFATWTPGVLEGTRESVPGGGVGAASPGSLKNLGDFGATLGAPLVKDRLWVFAGVAPALSRVEVVREGRTLFADQRGVQTLGKLTYLFNADHNVSLMVLSTSAHSGGEGRLTVDRLTGGVPLAVDTSAEAGGSGALDSTATLAAFTYSGAFLEKRLLFDVNVGWLHQSLSRQPVEEGTLDRYQAHAKTFFMARLAGEHILKAGVDAELLAHDPTVGTLRPAATSTLFSGYVQDSYSFLRRFTVNAGLRFDAQSLRVGPGGPSFTLPPALSPRLGVVVVPRDDSRVKLSAHYGQSLAWVPLIAVESASGGPVDPNRIPRAFREFVTSAEFELPRVMVLGAVFTHRNLDSAESALHRNYDGVTVSLRRPFADGWMTQLSYTLSRLRGNYPGLLLAPAGQGEPGLLPGIDAPEQVGRDELLPLDRRHSVKLIGARQFSLTRELTSTVGATYRGDSGAPVEGSGERTPWTHDLDVHADVGYWFDKDRGFTVSLDVFNVFDAQAATQVARDSTSTPVALQYQSPRQMRLGARYTF